MADREDRHRPTDSLHGKRLNCRPNSTAKELYMTPTPTSPTLAEMRKHRTPIRRVNIEHRESLSPLERAALSITNRVGTMGFFLLIFGWTFVWLSWNTLARPSLRFD